MSKNEIISLFFFAQGENNLIAELFSSVPIKPIRLPSEVNISIISFSCYNTESHYVGFYDAVSAEIQCVIVCFLDPGSCVCQGR